jgi:hypothetical protein
MRIRGELAIGCIFVPQTSHEGSWCQASIALPDQKLLPPPHWSPGPPSRSFLTQIICSRCRPCGVVGDALASSMRSGKSTGFCCHLHRRWPENAFSDQDLPHYGDVSCGCVAIRGLSPFIDCGFDARRTSHPVAVPRTAGTTIPHSQGHRAREGGSTLYFGISQPLSVTVRPPGSNAADQALVELAIMIPVLQYASACLHDSTRGDLTMADVS